MTGRKWPEAHDVLLVEQVRSGKCLREIYETSWTIFGCTYSRNSIGGRLWRMRKTTGDQTLRAGVSSGRTTTTRSRRQLTPEQRAEAEERRRRRPGGWLYAKRRELLRQLGGESPEAEDLRALLLLRAPPKKRRAAETPAGMNQYGVVCSEGATIHELVIGKCHWPLWQTSDPFDFDEMKYCGNTCTGCYCDAHKRIGYRPDRRKQTAEERVLRVRNHHRFHQHGGYGIGRAA